MDRRNKLITLATWIYGTLPHTSSEMCEEDFGNLSEVQITQFIYRVADLREMFYSIDKEYGHVVIDWRTLRAIVR